MLDKKKYFEIRVAYKYKDNATHSFVSKTKVYKFVGMSMSEAFDEAMSLTRSEFSNLSFYSYIGSALIKEDEVYLLKH